MGLFGFGKKKAAKAKSAANTSSQVNQPKENTFQDRIRAIDCLEKAKRMIDDERFRISVLTDHKEKVIRLLEEVYEKYPGEDFPYKDWGIAYQDVGKNEKAVWAYRMAMKKGGRNADYAQEKLGVLLYHGEGIEKNYEEAFEIFEKLAEQGFACSQAYLGLMYAYGQGCEEDKGKAVYWYERAAEQGYGDAICNLSLCYYYGRGIEQNYEKAMEWIQRAVDRKVSRGYYIKGVYYEEGKAVEQDLGEAFANYNSALTRRLLPKAEEKIKNIYENADEIEANYVLEKEKELHETNLQKTENLYKSAMASFSDDEKLQLMIQAADLGNTEACAFLVKYFFALKYDNMGYYPVKGLFQKKERQVMLRDVVQWGYRAVVLKQEVELLIFMSHVTALERMIIENEKRLSVYDSFSEDISVLMRYGNMNGFLFAGVVARQNNNRDLAQYYFKRVLNSPKSFSDTKEAAQKGLDSFT